MNEDRDTHDELFRDEAPTILVVEDYTDTRAMLCELLIRNGYKVVEAANGKEAIVTASRYNPDLIMDLAMPQMGGIEAVRRMRAVPKLAATPIIIASAYVTAEVRSDILAAGQAEVLSKPLNTNLLLEKISNILGATGKVNVL